MLIVIMANADQRTELSEKVTSNKVTIEYVNEYNELSYFKDADAVFILHGGISFSQIRSITIPVFINSVIVTLSDLNMPVNISRVNGWPTFLKREVWEIATKNEAMVKDIFEKTGWKYVVIPDEPGLVAARIIAMIINEAYFTYGEQISTKDEIDVAMKLGTNYPYGPFQWSEKIGLQNIYDLLKTLRKTNNRYEVSPALEKELQAG